MKHFPHSVYFFINSWTWGYEDILKGIAREFQSQVMTFLARSRHSVSWTLDRFTLIVTSTQFIITYWTHFSVSLLHETLHRHIFMHANIFIDARSWQWITIRIQHTRRSRTQQALVATASYD